MEWVISGQKHEIRTEKERNRSFSEKLEQALDALATGAEISVEEEMDDSLWGKNIGPLQEIAGNLE